MTIVADTSAILAVIMREAETEKIKQLTLNKKIIGPASIPWEVGNAFSAMFKRKRISLRTAQEGYEIFQMIPIQLVDVDIKKTLQLSFSQNIYAYDAYFLVCCENYNAALLSLDKKLLNAASNIGIKTLEI